MFTFTELTKDNVIAFKAHDKNEKEDYEKLTAVLDKTEREGKPVRLFVEIGDIKGITGEALLKDIATYFRHARKMEKVAVVGEDKLHEKTWAILADPFMKADVKYFPKEKQMTAEEWIRE
jgi:hypothetical protein